MFASTLVKHGRQVHIFYTQHNSRHENLLNHIKYFSWFDLLNIKKPSIQHNNNINNNNNSNSGISNNKNKNNNNNNNDDQEDKEEINDNSNNNNNNNNNSIKNNETKLRQTNIKNQKEIEYEEIPRPLTRKEKQKKLHKQSTKNLTQTEKKVN